ncbi:hypothetical protein LCGC14_0290540 [marine sediment metagenome]|uniref:Tetratricopeptide repeat protein n=1 Tax=marine sediment metagenome TaxID=412755 RepID=A0A0F9TT67_9ZZZZ
MEKWLITQRKQLINEYKENTEEQLMEKVKDFSLQAVFLLKRQIDPGFRIFIYEKIKEGLVTDKKLFTLFRKKILAFCRDIQFFVDLEIDDRNRNSWRKRTEVIVNLHKNNINLSPLKISSILKHHPNTVSYLLDVIDSLQRKGENERALATGSVLSEIFTGINMSNDCFTPIGPFESGVSYEKYRLLMNRFMIEEVRFEILDHFHAHRNNIFLTDHINLTIDLSGNLLESELKKFYELIIDATDVSNYKTEESQKNSQPIGMIYSDILVILSLIYWNNIKFKDKLNLINRFYGLSYLFSYINNNLKNLEIKDFHTLVNILYKYRFLSECKLLLSEYIKKESENILENALKMLQLAYIYILIDMNNFDEVESHFIKNFPKICENFPPDLKYYDKFISFPILHKWCMILYKTNKFEQLDRILNFLIDETERHENIEEKREIFFVISQIERMRENYKIERDYLNDALTDISNSAKKYDELNNRVKDYENVNFNYEEIAYYDKKKDIYNTIELALESQLMGDFKHSKEILNHHSDQIKILNNKEKYDIKYFEVLIFYYISAKQYNTALEILNLCLELNPNDEYLREYYYLINLKLKNTEIIKELSNTEVLKNLPFYREFLRNALHILGVDKFRELFFQILAYDEDGDAKANNALDIANLLPDLGFFSLSLEFYKYGLNFVKKEHIKASLLNGIGSVYSNLNDAEKSITYFKKAIEINPNNKLYYENLSMGYHLIPDYSKAKKAIKKAIEIAINQDSSQEELKTLRNKLVFIEVMLIEFPSVNKIKFEDTKQLFNHAFKLDRDYYKKNSSITEVANSIFNAYANALDSLLHNTLSKSFLVKIHEVYENDFDDCSSSIKKSMDIAIKYLFQGNHLTLPQWNKLLKNLKLDRTPLNLIEFKACMPNLKKQEYEILVKTIIILNNYRIPSVHGQITTLEEYREEKYKIIGNLNVIIDFLNDL